MSIFYKRYNRYILLLFLSCYLTISISFLNNPGFLVKAAPSNNSIQIAQQQYTQGNYLEAIAQFQEILNSPEHYSLIQQAEIKEKIARSYHLAGYASEAMDYWNEVIDYYESIGQVTKVDQLLLEKAQSYLLIGQPHQAIRIICNPLQNNSDFFRETEHDSNTNEVNNLGCTEDSILGKETDNTLLPLAARGIYAESLRLLGGENNYDLGVYILESIVKNPSLINTKLSGSIRLSLGNLYASKALIYHRRSIYAEDQNNSVMAKDFKGKSAKLEQDAQSNFQDILTHSSTHSLLLQIQAKSSLITSLYRSNQEAEADKENQELISMLENLPDSQTKAFLLIDIVSSPKHMEPDKQSNSNNCQHILRLDNAEELLMQANKIGEEQASDRLQSFTQGELGHFYECQAKNIESSLQSQKQEFLRKALVWTNQARLSAEKQRVNQDSLYLWEWQAARLYKELQQPQAERQAYQLAINTLDEIRTELISGNKDSRFDFRDNVEPLYRNFSSILIEYAQELEAENLSSATTLKTANQIIDKLRLAELQNFFGNECNLDLFRKNPVTEFKDTVVIRSIISSKKIDIITSFPGGQQKLYSLEIQYSNLRDQITNFKNLLASRKENRRLSKLKKESRAIYNMLLPEALIQELSNRDIKTLIFIHDGLLQSIPMSTLFNGEKYLIEDFAIATTPSLNVTVPNTGVDVRDNPVLLAGLLDSVKLKDGSFYRGLVSAEEEMRAIDATFNHKSTLMLGLEESFTVDNIEAALKKEQYSVVHLVTHGQFTFDPESSFILTEDEKEPIVSMARLEQVIRQTNTTKSRVDLLTLSGCDTAVGDPRSTLGLAGVALQAGVNSAIASLWPVEDGPSNALLMKKFYQEYLAGKSKAEALRSAQLDLIHRSDRFERPYYWSPFILIGNWN